MESVYADAWKGSPATTAIKLLVSNYGSSICNTQFEFTLCSYFNVHKNEKEYTNVFVTHFNVDGSDSTETSFLVYTVGGAVGGLVVIGIAVLICVFRQRFVVFV